MYSLPMAGEAYENHNPLITHPKDMRNMAGFILPIRIGSEAPWCDNSGCFGRK